MNVDSVVKVCNFLFYSILISLWLVLAGCEVNETGSYSNDTDGDKNVDIALAIPTALKGALAQELKARLVIDDQAPVDLQINPDQSVSGKIQGVSVGTHTLTITYYIILDAVEVVLATVTRDNVVVSKGQNTDVTIGDGELNRVFDADEDGFTNLDEVNARTDPNDKTSFLASIDVSPTNPNIIIGMEQQFVATGIYPDQSTRNLTELASWDSSDTGVASVSDVSGTKGLVKGLVAGVSTISAALYGVIGNAALTVSSLDLVSLAINPVDPVMANGTLLQLSATGTFSDASTRDMTAQVTWSSSVPAVASFPGSPIPLGKIQANSVGASQITVAYDGITASTGLTVSAAELVTLAITPTNPTVAKGTKQQFVATGIFSDDSTQDMTKEVAWNSSDTAVATISDVLETKGLLSGITEGTSSISAVWDTISGGTMVTVTPEKLESILISPADFSLGKGTTQQLTATGTFTDSTSQNITAQVSWAVSDSNIATVSNAAGSKGLLSAVSVGTVTITALLDAINGSTSATVVPAELVSLEVTPKAVSIANGTSQQYTATGSYEDSSTQDLTNEVTWSSSNTGVATISNAVGSKGLVKSAGEGSTTIKAVMGVVSGTTNLTVTPIELIAIDVTPASVAYPLGTEFSATATGRYTDSSSQILTDQVTWASSSPSVASVSNAAASKGLVTTTGLGKTIISAGFGGVSGSTGLTVNPQLVGSTITIGRSQSYDFSTKSLGSITQGDFYIASANTNNFWANNAGMQGLVDVGNTTNLYNAPVPAGGYIRTGVPVEIGKTYVAKAATGEPGAFIVFKVLKANVNNVTLVYIYIDAAKSVTLASGEGYDFSAATVGDVAHGDFYFLFQNNEIRFWANNTGMQGLLDVGTGSDLFNTAIPSGAYTSFGVLAVAGHTYVSKAATAEDGHYIIFNVTSANNSSVTLSYIYK